MRHYPFYFILVFLCISSLCSAQKQKYNSAVVVFYNLENFYDTEHQDDNYDKAFTEDGEYHYTKEVFNQKVNNLAKVISLIGKGENPDGPAILGIAEVENANVIQKLLDNKQIKSRNYRFVHYDSKDSRGVDVAMIYNPKYFEVEKSEPLFVKLPANTSKENNYTRDVLWVTGYLMNEKVHIFVNHWPSRYGGEKRSIPARMAAANTARNVINKIFEEDPNANIIVMGDLNDDPINVSITEGLKAKGKTDMLKPFDLYNPWVENYKKGDGTLAYSDAWSLFDQIIFSQSLLNRRNGLFYYKHRIFKPSFLIENMGRYKNYSKRTYSFKNFNAGYSDHFPTYLILLKKAK